MSKMMYDLEERVSVFGEDVIRFAKTVPLNEITRPLVRQLVRSGTSVGANYMEANHASSKKDFRNKIKICAKEANETKHWLRMISKSDEKLRRECQKLWKEAHELTLIFSKIIRTTDGKN
jgi:four helix bundle protein